MKTFSLLLAALAFSPAAFAAPPVPADPFGDAMVLQREAKVPVWGTAGAGDKVVVAFAGQTKEAVAGADGAWRVELDPMKASDENQVMTLSCGADKAEIKDVLVGEVWLCSGQSNMEWSIAKTPMAKAAAQAHDPALRIRQIRKAPADAPQVRVQGTPWLKAEGKPLQEFSAVAYAFGAQLRGELKVPVGLVGAYWGGTRIEAWTPPGAKPEVPVKAHKAAHQQQAVLYHGMVHPWKGYALRGALWYQGESNCNPKEAEVYADRMRAMVSGWRAAWGQGDFPFYFVQLAPYNYGGGSALPLLWAAQTEAAKDIPNAGMAPTQDIGNWRDIHPTNKQPVGERLARLALSRTYGKTVADDCGPLFASAKADGAKVKVAFGHAKSGLASRDGKPLSGFEVAGADGVFTPAEAAIVDGAVVVSAPSVGKPAQVRFAWRTGVDTNLVNGEKLPAAAFFAPVE